MHWAGSCEVQHVVEDYELGCAPGRPGNPLSYVGRDSEYENNMDMLGGVQHMQHAGELGGALQLIKSSAPCWVKARFISVVALLWH